MANNVHLNSVVHSNPVTGRTLYGVNIFDDGGDEYDLSWEQQEVMTLRGLDILKKVVMDDAGDMGEIVGYALQEKRGMIINDEYFDHNEVFKVCEETAAIRDGEEYDDVTAGAESYRNEEAE